MPQPPASGRSVAVVELDTCYLDTARRVIALSGALSAADAERPVPSCPGWSVRDTVAHLAGLAEDVAAGAVDGYGSEPWTAEHIARAGGQPLATVLDRWERALAPLATRLADPAAAGLPRAIATLSLFDLAVHEHDLRSALGQPGARDAAAAQFVTDAALRRLDRAFGQIAAPIEVVLDDGPHLLGASGSEPVAVDPARVEVATFDFWRATVGRRSRSQVEAWGWSAGSQPWIELLVPPAPGSGPAPVDWPATALVE